MVDPVAVRDLYLSGRVPVGGSPAEPVAVNAVLDFSAAFNYVIDFTVLNQPLVIGLIKSMFIDNTETPNEVIVSVEGTQQRFTVPAFAEGYFHITATQTTKVILESDGGGATKSNVAFFNEVKAPVVWYKYGLDPNDGNVKAEGTMEDGAVPIANEQFKNPVYIGGKEYATDTFRGIAVDATGKLTNHVGDGEDVTQGAKADAAWNGAAAAPSIVAILKSLYTKLFNRNQGPDYENAPAGATTMMGGAGAVGDILAGVIIVPAAAAPGPVDIKDGATTIRIFVGGATITTTAPFTIDLKGIASKNAGWELVCGAGVAAVGVGDFT